MSTLKVSPVKETSGTSGSDRSPNVQSPYATDKCTCPSSDSGNILGDDEGNKRLPGLGDEIITDPARRPEILNKIFGVIDENCGKYVAALTEVVGMRSVSAWPDARKECYRAVLWAMNKLEELGFKAELRKVGDEEIDGKAYPVPPIILASLGSEPKRPTVLIYGHLDVKPARESDGWNSDPFILKVDDGKMFGRGTSDNKGPVLGWLHAIQAYIQTKTPIQINIKIVLESMLECGSEGMNELMAHEKTGFLADVDIVIISDSYWLSRTKPCVTYGLRGLCYFFVEVECGSKDLHSGVFGGAVREALPDLIWLLDQLVDVDGNILIPGILDNVAPILPEEEMIFENVEFDMEEFKEDCGVRELKYSDDKTAALMARWRYPSLTIHGIQGAYGDPGSKTVIPRKVIGKFSISIVPNQNPDRIDKLVRDFMQERWEARGSPNRMECYMADDGFRPWCADPFQPSFKAARQATAWAYECVPDLTRDGGTIERLLKIQEATDKSILLLPMGSCDDKPHNINEKLNVENYINGTKVFAAFIHEVSRVDKADFLQQSSAYL